MKIIAHRGASAYAPENTLDAFSLALQMGSKDFEFDVHRTKDGVLVVNHNYFVTDISEKKLPISTLAFEQLAKIDVSRYIAFAGFHRVPKLEEVLVLLGNAANWLNIEIKNDGNIYAGIEEEVLHLVKQQGLINKCLFSSFNYGTLQRFRALDGNISLGYLCSGINSIVLRRAIKAALAVKAENFHIPLKIASKRNIEKIKEAGLHCCVYTVNTKEKAMRLKSYGACGIFSNYPDIMGEWKLKP